MDSIGESHETLLTERLLLELHCLRILTGTCRATYRTATKNIQATVSRYFLNKLNFRTILISHLKMNMAVRSSKYTLQICLNVVIFSLFILGQSASGVFRVVCDEV